MEHSPSTWAAFVRSSVRHTYRHAVSVFRANESRDDGRRLDDGSHRRRESVGPYRGSRFKRSTSNRPARQSARRYRGGHADVARVASFDSRSLTRQASKGEVIVTAVMLVGDVVVLRGGAFVQDSFRVG